MHEEISIVLLTTVQKLKDSGSPKLNQAFKELKEIGREWAEALVLCASEVDVIKLESKTRDKLRRFVAKYDPDVN